jgi:arylsulfatase A-like enzyme
MRQVDQPGAGGNSRATTRGGTESMTDPRNDGAALSFVLTLVFVVLVIVWWFRAPPTAEPGPGAHPIYGHTAAWQDGADTKGVGAVAEPGVPAGRWKGASVIVVEVDALRADHLGFHGYERDTSPNIDRLAAASVRFEWAFSQAGDTAPSQASIQTGLYPTHHGRTRDDLPLPDPVTTLAERLSEAGYRTAAFVDGSGARSGSGMEQGFERYDDAGGGLEQVGPRLGSWLDERGSDSQPFFLFLQTREAAAPYDRAPEPFRTRYSSRLDNPFEESIAAEMERAWDARNDSNHRIFDAGELAYLSALYDGSIHYVDAWMGGFVADLRRRGLFDSVLLVLVSDHGQEFGEHGSVMHGKLFATVTRVPMLLKLPGSAIRSGVDAPVETTDLVPTLLDALALPVPEGLDGASLLPLASGQTKGAQRIAISESPRGGRSIAIATRRFRLLTSLETGRTEMFRYREDPLESSDVAADEPEVAEILLSASKVWHVVVEGGLEPEKDTGWLKHTAMGQLHSLSVADR